MTSVSSSQPRITAIAIGPVQDFIATARRTRDLWAGSRILSETAKAVAQAIASGGGELIFPDASVLGADDSSAPNKILAIVADDDAIAAAVKHARKRLTELARESRKAISGTLHDNIYNAQIDDLLEIYWASAPYDPAAYAPARRQVEWLLAARKTTRDFRPASFWSAPVPKCSLDGQRESLMTEPVSVTEDARKSERLRRSFGTKRGERLCAVCLMKRNLPLSPPGRFVSTSEIAGRTYLQAARRKASDRPDIAKAFDSYAKVLGCRTEEITGEHLYDERLKEEIPPERLEAAQLALRELLASVDLDLPSPYYAILQADGDGMGEFLDSISEKKSHQRLSKRLSEFAGAARSKVEGSNGALVYAGGDDVLAFLPLHRAIECARTLSEAFSEILREEFPGKATPSLSAGIAIVHHLEPLSDALDLVRQAEKRAKSIPGKNALAVVLSKRGGGDRFVADKWGVIDRQLEWLTEVFQSEWIASGTPYEILRALERFTPRSEIDPLPQELQEPFRTEIERIVTRRRAVHGTEDVDPRILETVTAMFHQSLGAEETANRMIIADFLAGARRLSQIEVRSLDDVADHPPPLSERAGGSLPARAEPSTVSKRARSQQGTGRAVWIIEPRDRFVARDGRPFSAVPGSRATSLPFPFPSTTTGGVRTRAGLDANGIFDESKSDEVKKIKVRGPFLVELSSGGEIEEWLAPAPADALLLTDADGRISTRRLVPLTLGDGSIEGSTDLDGLSPVGLATFDPRKPYARSPRWWRWDSFEQWLLDPAETDDVDVAAIGSDGPMKDRRTHVSIDPDNQAAVEGALFETRALVFSGPSGARLAMAVETDASIAPGPALLGGERRLVVWRRSKNGTIRPPADLSGRIAVEGHCRIVFLTPAYFPAGFPSTTSFPHGLELIAAAVPRHQVVSGWNFEHPSPKPTRRLLPAGSVLFMKCGAGAGWVGEQWLQPFGLDNESMHDGFGVAAIGTWRPA